MRRIRTLFTLTTLALIATGCTTSGIHHQPTKRFVAIKAIQDIVKTQGIEGDYAYSIAPELQDIEDEVFVRNLGPNAHRVEALPSNNLPTIAVASVIIRGWNGTVDVVQPSDASKLDRPRQVVTLHMTWELGGGWYVRHRHVWAMPADQALKAIADSRGPAASEPAIIPDEDLPAEIKPVINEEPK